MNDSFENIAGAIELSSEDLMMIQGGNIFGDAWRWTKKAAKDVYNAVSSKDGQKAVETVGGVLGIIGGIIAIFG
jgi:hypothetical protein